MKLTSVQSRPLPPPGTTVAAGGKEGRKGGGGGGGGGEERKERGTGGGIYEELEAFGGKPFSMKRNTSYSTVVVRNAL